MNGFVFPRAERTIVLNGGTGADIQAALDSLTAGRTHVERVVVEGELAVATQIDIPSWAELKIIGRLNSSLSTGHVLSAANKSSVYLSGNGMIDCNTAAGTSNGINFDTVTNFAIGELNVLDSRAHCINVNNSSRGRVYETLLNGFGDDGVSVLGSSDIRLLENEALNGTSVIGGSSGFEVEDNCRDIILIGNDAHDIVGRGISVVTDVDGTGANSGVVIIGSTVYSCTTDGINVENVKTSITGVTLSGTGSIVTATTPSDHGLSVGAPISPSSASEPLYNMGSTRILSVPTADTLTYAATGASAETDGVIDFFETGVEITANSVRDCDNYGMRIVGAHQVGIDNNIIHTCLRGINLSGSNRIGISTNKVTDTGTEGITSTTTDNINSSNNIVTNAGLDSNSKGIYWTNCVNLTSIGDSVTDNQAVPTTDRTGYWAVTGEVKTTDLTEIGLRTANRTFGGAGTDINLMAFRGCNLFGDSTRGSATVAAGTSSIAVTHGLMTSNDDTPDLDSIQVTPTSLLTDSSVNAWKIGNMTDTQFTITLDTNAVTNPVTFQWHGRLDLVQQ